MEGQLPRDCDQQQHPYVHCCKQESPRVCSVSLFSADHLLQLRKEGYVPQLYLPMHLKSKDTVKRLDLHLLDYIWLSFLVEIPSIVDFS
ncbi:hypothetical protein L1049_009549 [Liquidambar formosana]|uniref:Uncharacterized protein n=1 Tax=Liquidambar formosana TaxID=63359 RepID=A0AAP0N5Y6_LIQFO